MYTTHAPESKWSWQGILLVMLMAALVAALVAGTIWGIVAAQRAFRASTLPPPVKIVKIVKKAGLCFAIAEANEGIAMVLVPCNGLREKP